MAMIAVGSVRLLNAIAVTAPSGELLLKSGSSAPSVTHTCCTLQMKSYWSTSGSSPKPPVTPPSGVTPSAVSPRVPM